MSWAARSAFNASMMTSWIIGQKPAPPPARSRPRSTRPAKMVHIGVAGAAGEDFIPDDQHGGCGSCHRLLLEVLRSLAGIGRAYAAFKPRFVRATLIRRYKRFLADIRLPDGWQRTCDRPLSEPRCDAGPWQSRACAIWVEPNDDPQKKLKYGWRLNRSGGRAYGRVLIPACPISVVGGALAAPGQFRRSAEYTDIRAEVKYGEEQPDRLSVPRLTASPMPMWK